MKAYELLDKPEKWTQNAFGKLPNGIATGSKDPEACSWCLSGALIKCYDIYEDSSLYQRQRDKVISKLGIHILRWNDTPGRTYEEVIALLKELDI